jgi:hypothetical protein
MREKLDELAKSRDEMERLIGAGRTVWAVKDAGQGMYAIEEYDPETKQRREIAASVEKLYALEFAALHNAFPAILEYVRGLEGERDELRRYREDETQRRAKADCYDRICDSLGVPSNALAALADRDARQRLEELAERLMLGEFTIEDQRDAASCAAAWAWVESRKALVSRQHGQWFCAVDLDRYANGPTPLSAVLDAMRNAAVEAAPEVKP